MPQGPSSTLGELQERATRSDARAARDRAFAQLLGRADASLEVLLDVTQQTRGIAERRDRIHALGTPTGGPAEPLDATPLMEWVACHDRSLFVRTEACLWLTRQEHMKETALRAVFEAALERGEQPRDSVMGDCITPVLQASCRTGGGLLAGVLARIAEGVPFAVSACLLDLLAQSGREQSLQALHVAWSKATAADGDTDSNDHGSEIPGTSRWSALQLRLAEAMLAHGLARPPMLVSLALSSPVTRVRLAALDALRHPGMAEVEALEPLLRAQEDSVSRAAGRAVVRAGAHGEARLRAVASAALPKASPAWWALVEVDPCWCHSQMNETPLGMSMALLPGRGHRPAGSALLRRVSESTADLRLRKEATHRLLSQQSGASPQLVALWLRALHLQAAPVDTASSDDVELADLVRDEFDGLVDTRADLRVLLPALLALLTPADLPELGQALCAVDALDAAAEGSSGAIYAGLLYHDDDAERLQAYVGLCQHPVGSLAEALLQRSRVEVCDLLKLWAVAAAWVAWRSMPKSPKSRRVWEGLCRASPALVEALQSDVEPPGDARDALLAEWLALDAEPRMQALIDLSRAHRGRKLNRVQARDLSRALARPGRARHIVSLLRSPDKPRALARALVIARRSGAGRSRRQAAAEHDLEDAFLEPEQVLPEPDPPPAHSDDDDAWDDELPPPEWPDWDLDSEGASLDTLRVVAPIRPDIAQALMQLQYVPPAAAPRDQTTLRDAVQLQELGALRELIDNSVRAQWRRVLPGVPLGGWPEERPLVLTSPQALAALELCREARWQGHSLHEDGRVLGRLGQHAWQERLSTRPPEGPDLTHLAQALGVYAAVFPAQTSRLVETQGAHHPQWRPLLFLAWLSAQERQTDLLRPLVPTHAVRMLERASRSALISVLQERLGSLPRNEGSAHRSLHGGAGFMLPPPLGNAPPPLDIAPPPMHLDLPGERRSGPSFARVAPVLAAGAWSTEGMDYPTVRLTVRKGYSLSLETRLEQESIVRLLSVPAMLHRIAADGRPEDLLRLVWRQDLLPRGGTLLPVLDDPVDDAGLLNCMHLFRELPPEAEPPDDPALTPSELLALPPHDTRAVVRSLPPHRRLFVAQVIEALQTPAKRSSGRRTSSVVGGPPSWWAHPDQEAVLKQVMDDARAYVLLRHERPGRTRIARKILRRFWRRPDASEAPSLRELGAVYGAERVIEGLVQGLLTHLVDGAPPSSTARPRDKQIAVRALRQLCLAWGFTEPDSLTCRADDGRRSLEAADGWMDESEVRDRLRQLDGMLHQVPGEVAVALGLSDSHGLPMLLGGARTELERQMMAVVSDLAPQLSQRADVATPGVVYELRPLPKVEAVLRGDLGGDCSTSTVPFRCMSPHHTYYGVFLDGQPQRGYLTVFEAWARQPDGAMAPSLVLETINIPISLFDSVQLDLVHLVEAIAHQRGLASRIAMVRAWWAWNYSNGRALQASRVCRGGSDTAIDPADPACWATYRDLMPYESNTYSPFVQNDPVPRLLAATDPTVDGLQPENAVEAARIRALVRKTPIPTAWEGDRVVGFISSLPE